MFLFAKTIESVHAFANTSDIYEFYNTTYQLAFSTHSACYSVYAIRFASKNDNVNSLGPLPFIMLSSTLSRSLPGHGVCVRVYDALSGLATRI